MKNKLKIVLATVTLAVIVASCSFFRSEKPVADQKDTVPEDTTVQVSPPDTIPATTPGADTVDSQ